YKKKVPTVQSIVRAGAASACGSSVDFTATFSEAVFGVDTGDFTLTTTGFTGAPSITSVTGSGTTYTVTVNTGTGNGTIGLNLVDDDSIKDMDNTPLGGTGAGNGNFPSAPGQVYTITKGALTISCPGT